MSERRGFDSCMGEIVSNLFKLFPVWCCLLLRRSMEILTLLAVIVSLSMLVFVLKRRARSREMYIKREGHIQAFPPGHRKSDVWGESAGWNINKIAQKICGWIQRRLYYSFNKEQNPHDLSCRESASLGLWILYLAWSGWKSQEHSFNAGALT